MSKTWVIVEDNSAKCRHYITTLLDRNLPYLDDGETILCIAPKSVIKNLKNNIDCDGTLLRLIPIETSDEIINCLIPDGSPLQKLLVILDVNLQSIQTKDDFNKSTSKLYKLWQNLHKDDANNNLIIINTAEAAPRILIEDEFKPENPKRFLQGPGFGGTTENAYARGAINVIEHAYNAWQQLNNPSLKLLTALVHSQKIGQRPGHPDKWSEVTDNFEFKKYFPSADVEQFKSLFYYQQQPARWESNATIDHCYYFTCTQQRWIPLALK